MGKKLTTYDFIKRAKEVHGEKYDYSSVEYKTSHSKIIIICLEHGEFDQIPNNHLNGKGCNKCGGKEVLDINIFIKRAKDVHGEKYDYSLVNYKNNRSKIKIICPDHGEFEQRSSHHFYGIGCPKCVGRNKTTIDFIEELKNIHGEKYDYSLVEYKNAVTKVKIICPEHSIFLQNPHSHLSGNGCPICNESSGERLIRVFLMNNNIKYIKNKKFDT